MRFTCRSNDNRTLSSIRCDVMAKIYYRGPSICGTALFKQFCKAIDIRRTSVPNDEIAQPALTPGFYVESLFFGAKVFASNVPSSLKNRPWNTNTEM